jgi:hypothetical protein
VSWARVSITTSSRAQTPVAVVGLVKSISGWWTRWLDRKLGEPIALRRKSTIASRPWKAYLPPLYEQVASAVKHVAISSHRFWSRQRRYLYLRRLIASSSCRSTGIGVLRGTRRMAALTELSQSREGPGPNSMSTLDGAAGGSAP